MKKEKINEGMVVFFTKDPLTRLMDRNEGAAGLSDIFTKGKFFLI